MGSGQLAVGSWQWAVGSWQEEEIPHFIRDDGLRWDVLKRGPAGRKCKYSMIPINDLFRRQHDCSQT